MYREFENELENKVLYILLAYPEKQEFIINNLEERFFQDKLNSMIFNEAKRLYLNNEEIDKTIIVENLKNNDIAFRLDEIDCDFANSVFAAKYCKLIFKRYMENLIKDAKTEADYNEIKKLKEHYLFEENKILHISDNTKDFDKIYEEKRKTTIFTYYSKLDSVVGSFMGGDYIALGGSTGTGKTSIALNLARQACIQDKTVLYFSLEMPIEQLQNRFVCMNEELPASKYRSFGYNLTEMMKYKQGLENLKEWNLHVVADYNLTPDKIRTYIQEQKKKKLDFVIIDYLGLIQGYNNKSLYEKTTVISRRIKLIATEFNIPILVLVQLNRNFKDREDKRPMLSDIRESGAIEQDSDFVLFAHRPEQCGTESEKDCLEIIVAKNRHGVSQKIVALDFDLKTQLISESAGVY